MKYETIYWDDVIEGEELPILTREITATTVVSGTIAVRDFYPLHHDFHFAKKAGLRHIVTSYIITSGYLSSYLTKWSGPEGELKRIKFRIRASCYPGDTLTMKGKIVKKHIDKDKHLVDIEYDFTVLEGSHCKGSAAMILPTKNAVPG